MVNVGFRLFASRVHENLDVFFGGWGRCGATLVGFSLLLADMREYARI